VATASVMLGTLYPMLLDALGLDKISVGAPYFDSVFVPIMTPAIFLMGIAPLARWKSARLPQLAVRLRWAALVSVATAIALPLVLGSWRPLVALGVLIAAWTFASVAVSVRERIVGVGGKHVTRAVIGMWIAHAGVGAFVLGVTLVKTYAIEEDARLTRGASVEVAGYRFRLDDVRDVDGPNYRATQATVVVSRDGRDIATLHPEKRMFDVSNTQTTEAAIDHGVFRDLYVAMDRQDGADAWTLRIQIKPFVRWIWAGCALMAAGGLLAATNRRRVRVAAPDSAQVTLAGETGR
jgi:cytochrome c-type biogenesis protein CcmF